MWMVKMGWQRKFGGTFIITFGAMLCCSCVKRIED
jgi:hypothetical protein